MKLIVAIIRSEKLAAVKRALNKRNIDKMTVTDVFGSGHERGHSYIYRSTRIEESLLSRLKLEIAVDENSVNTAIEAIRKNAHTGQVGDGIIWVVALEKTIPIRSADEWGRPTDEEFVAWSN